MELQGNNTPTIVITTTSNSRQEIVDIEKQKLQAQREALKLQQGQLKLSKNELPRSDAKQYKETLINIYNRENA